MTLPSPLSATVDLICQHILLLPSLKCFLVMSPLLHHLYFSCWITATVIWLSMSDFQFPHVQDKQDHSIQLTGLCWGLNDIFSVLNSAPYKWVELNKCLLLLLLFLLKYLPTKFLLHTTPIQIFLERMSLTTLGIYLSKFPLGFPYPLHLNHSFTLSSINSLWFKLLISNLFPTMSKHVSFNH